MIPGSHSERSKRIRAAALDSEDPIGKSLGLGRLFIEIAVGFLVTDAVNSGHPSHSFRHQKAEPLHLF